MCERASGRGLGVAARGVCKIITGFSGENDSLGKQTQAVYEANVKQLQEAYVQDVNNCIDDARGKLEGRTKCWDPAAVTRDARQCVVVVRAVLDGLLRQNDAAYGNGAFGQGPVPGIGEAARICSELFG